MKEVKSLYELVRDKMFMIDYYCEYCGLTDSDGWFMIKHVNTWHDEGGKPVKMFRCKKCFNVMIDSEIMEHECK